MVLKECNLRSSKKQLQLLIFGLERESFLVSGRVAQSWGRDGMPESSRVSDWKAEHGSHGPATSPENLPPKALGKGSASPQASTQSSRPLGSTAKLPRGIPGQGRGPQGCGMDRSSFARTPSASVLPVNAQI